MSVFRLEAGVHMPIDSRYVGAVELEIVNRGASEFNMWIQMHGSGGLMHEMLVGVPGGGRSKQLPPMGTFTQPFTLLLVSNANRYDTTELKLTARQNGELVALFTQEHFERVH